MIVSEISERVGGKNLLQKLLQHYLLAYVFDKKVHGGQNECVNTKRKTNFKIKF